MTKFVKSTMVKYPDSTWHRVTMEDKAEGYTDRYIIRRDGEYVYFGADYDMAVSIFNEIDRCLTRHGKIVNWGMVNGQ